MLGDPKMDIGFFDKNDNDQANIDRGIWVPCRICQNAFRRLRMTARYCDTCKRGFCEGEHGNFAAKSGKGRCTSCGDKALGYI
jgi:hypothetical protein